jgi:GxxExxY protein
VQPLDTKTGPFDTYFGRVNGEDLIEERLTRSIIGAFYRVYRTLGFGFLEHVYILALERELRARGHQVARQVSVGIMYDGEELCTQRLDMVVDDKVVVETKSTYELHPAAQRQLYNYLRATRLEVGLLFHFGREPQFYRLMYRNPTGCGPRSENSLGRSVRRSDSGR